MKLYGLIGYPLGHSFSKKYFTEKFEREGLHDSRFELFPIATIEEFPQLLASHPELKGLSVTIPYKQKVLQYIDRSEIPAGVSACNSIRIKDGKLTGFNTDIAGFEKSFSALLQEHHKKALVLGNGGAAEAVTYVLGKLGIAFKVVSRRLHGVSTLTYSDITPEIMSEYNVIINTTPLGTYPAIDGCPDIPYQFITDSHYLFDLVYNPEETMFLQKGKARGAIVKNGYDMLQIQAEESWQLWNS